MTKDNEGRETTTVIKKSGEDCYTVTTIKHPDGREERQESNSCPQLNDFSRSFSGQLGSLARESIVDRIFKFYILLFSLPYFKSSLFFKTPTEDN